MAKIFKKIVLWTLIVSLLFFISLMIFVRVNGKLLAQDYLSHVFHQNVSIGALLYQFPFVLKAESVQFGDVVKIGKIEAGVLLKQCSFENIRFSHIFLEDVFVIFDVSKQMGKNVGGMVSGEISVSVIEKVIPEQNKESIDIFMDSIQVKGAELHYIYKQGGRKSMLVLKDVFFSTEDLTLPLKLKQTAYQLKAKVEKKDFLFTGYEVESSGWIDIINRDMLGDVFIKNKTSDIVLSANLFSENNDMMVKGILFSEKIKKSFEPTSTDSYSMSDKVIQFLYGVGVDIGQLHFSFPTKMDAPRIEKLDFSGQATMHE